MNNSCIQFILIFLLFLSNYNTIYQFHNIQNTINNFHNIQIIIYQFHNIQTIKKCYRIINNIQIIVELYTQFKLFNIITQFK